MRRKSKGRSAKVVWGVGACAVISGSFVEMLGDDRYNTKRLTCSGQKFRVRINSAYDHL